MKVYTESINDNVVIMAEPETYDADMLTKMLENLNLQKVTFQPEIKVRHNDRFAYISEIKKVRTFYMVQVEVNNDKAYRQAAMLDKEMIKSIVSRLKIMFSEKISK